MATVYRMDFGKGRLIPLTSEGKNDLQVGRVLKLNGYEDPRYVIVGVLPVDPRWSRGTRYKTVSIDKHRFHVQDALELRFIAEKQDNRIQMYIMDEILPSEEVAALVCCATVNESIDAQQKDKAEADRNATLERGRAVAAEHIPPEAKALLVAEYNVDTSDIQSDYFGHTTKEMIVLGWSKHTRDDFKEMRKAAALLDETKHLSDGTEKVEHREKWSMGNGYYLKDGHSHDTGWAVSKRKKYGDRWDDTTLIALGRQKHAF